MADIPSDSAAAAGPAASSGPAVLVEHFFRHEAGRLHGALTRRFGVHNLSLIEDVVQEAMLRALRTWSMGGVPPNPSAWISRVAINLALDALRHDGMSAAKEDAIAAYLEQTAPASPAADVAPLDSATLTASRAALGERAMLCTEPATAMVCIGLGSGFPGVMFQMATVLSPARTSRLASAEAS